MEKSNLNKPIIKKIIRILIMTAGSLIYAVGISLFLDPNSLAPGGVSGIGIILSSIIPRVHTGTWILIMNIPLMILGAWKFGFKFMLSSIYCVVLSSVSIDFLIDKVGALTDELLLACVAGAVLVSAGIGLVFRAGATTGGSDIVVKLIRTKFRHVNTGNIFLAVDGVIIILAGLVFRDINLALYAGISVFIQMIVLNMVLYGSDEARIVYIISEKREKIAERIMEELDAGATYLYGKGGYSGNENHILFCVLKMRALPQARDIVRELDANAFMIVTNATSVFGEGFKPHDSGDL